MKAITVEPHHAGSARLEDVPEPDVREGSVLVEAVAVGVCGTDVEIAEGKYGWAPPGAKRLVLGHESLGRVVDPGPAASLKAGVAAADVAAEIVLRNIAIVGSVNANKRHWYRAGEAQARADRAWLKRLVTRSARPEEFARALQREPDDVKVAVQFAQP
jgi:threonine dehydrogenase-like Zn-dependent dehydrogenase